MTAIDPFTAASPHYIAAQSKGVRTLPLEPLKDERPVSGFLWVLAGAFVFFFGLGFGLRLLWGAL